jgi:hypothetical protein
MSQLLNERMCNECAQAAWRAGRDAAIRRIAEVVLPSESLAKFDEIFRLFEQGGRADLSDLPGAGLKQAAALKTPFTFPCCKKGLPQGGPKRKCKEYVLPPVEPA